MAAGLTNLDIYSRVMGPSADSQLIPASPQGLNKSPKDDELGQRVMNDVDGSEGTFRSWEGPAREDNRYYHGNQWDDVDRLKMEQLKRPALTFNEIKPVINAVSGLERLNRTDVRFVTRALDSPIQMDLAGDLATEACTAAEDLCSATEEDSDLAKDVAITGMGWAEIKTSYDIDVNGRITYERFPVWEARWDPNCTRPNLDGRGWCARKRQFSRKQFEKEWPGMLEKVDMAVPDMPYGQAQKYELVTPYYSTQNQQANPQVGSQTQLKKTVEVIQYQWKDMETIYRFQDQDSEEITTLDEDKWDRLSDRMKQADMTPPPSVRQKRPVYRQVYVCRGVVLEDPVDLPGGFSLICMTGEYNDEKKRFTGIVGDMKDPQKTKNKAISSALGFHITNAKGGTVFKTSAFADPDHAKDQWSRSDAWIEVNDDTNIQTDIVQREPAKMSPDLGLFYQEGTKAISRVTGINEETVGIAAGNTPSETSKGRQQGGLVVLGWYWDNLNRHRKERAAVMLEFIREYWTQGQLMSVGGDNMAQQVPLIKESLPDRWAYTMVLDESIRHNPNLKYQVWHDLMETGVIQALMKFGAGQIILQLLKFSPFPASVVAMIQRSAAQNPPQPPQKGRGQGPGKQPENPQLTQAKIGQHQAQTQKILAQARQIDQQSKTDPGIKQAELAVNAALRAHELRLKREQQTSKMAQLARQTGFENGPQV